MAREKRRFNFKERLRGEAEHAYENKGSTGLFGDFYTPDDIPFFKPQAGKHEFAIIPFIIENLKNNIFRRGNPKGKSVFNKPFTKEDYEDGAAPAFKLILLVHNNVGPNKERVICPRTYYEACPICDYLNTLDKEEREDHPLNASRRCLFNVVVFDSQEEREKGIQIYDAPAKAIMDAISTKLKDSRDGEEKDYADPEEGWNIYFVRKGKGKTSTEYANVDIVERYKDDDFTPEELDDLLNSAFVLDEIVRPDDYETLKALLGDVSTYSSEEEGEERGSRRERRTDDREERTDRGRDRGRERNRERERDERPDREAPARERPEREERSSRRGRDEEKEKEPEKPSRERTKKTREDKEETTTDEGDSPKCFGQHGFNSELCDACDPKIYEECWNEVNKRREKQSDGGRDDSRSERRTGRERVRGSRR